ncbi:MAG: hypothetical protein L6R36_004925, partial [Xanthoria steineri]
NAAAEILLQYSADVNARGENGETPMHAVLLSDDKINDQQRLTMIQLLSDHDADPNMSDIDGETPLFTAVRNRHIDIIRYLISEDGCNINAKNTWEETPLQVAILDVPDECLEALLLGGADLSAMDHYGMRCLDWIKRSRPRLLESEILRQQLNDVAIERDTTIIRRKAIEGTKSLASTSKADLKPSDTFYKLCTHLFLLDMELDALLAYQLDFPVRKDHPGSLVYCDGCNNRRTRDDPFYKCKVCPGTDLCDRCMVKYQEQPLLDYCRGHDFLRAIVSEARITLDQPEEVQRWLLEIERKIESAETDENERRKPSS